MKNSLNDLFTMFVLNQKKSVFSYLRFYYRISILIGISVIFLGLFASTSYAALVGADGKTFEQRRQEWLNSMPDPETMNVVSRTDPNQELILDSRVENYLFGWLENCAIKADWKNKCRGDVVTQAIEWFVGSSYWIDLGPKQHRGFAIMIALKYYGGSPYNGNDKADVISQKAYDAVIKRYRDEVIGQAEVFGDGNPNKEIASVVGAYLYTAYYDRNAQFSIFACPGSTGNCLGTNWKTFSYPTSKGGTGKTFVLGSGPYNAYELMRDWLMYRMDGWYSRTGTPYGNREFDSNNYHRHFPHQMMLLAQFAPENDIKRRAKMSADIAILDALMDFSANAWGGTIARTDYNNMDRYPVFAYLQIFGMPGDDGKDDKWDMTTLYAANYAPSNLLILLSKFDETWRFHKEYNEGLQNSPGFGKWTYLTKDYNMGSNVGQRNQGWTASIRGPGTSFIRFFINSDTVAPAGNTETSYQGNNGRQYRNAMYVDTTNPHYWEFQSGTGWSEQSTESGWMFKRLGNTFVAIRLGSTNAAVEIAQQGVDYPSYTVFKDAVKNNAQLSSSSYTTSKGKIIGKNDYCGLNVAGDCKFPFNRMETESSSGKLIDWNNNVMTVSKGGLKCIYDFNNWLYSGNCDSDKTSPPVTTTVPTTTTTISSTKTGDLNNDRKIDVIDLGILLSSWGRTDKPPADLNQDGRVDIVDLGILLSLWGKTYQ